MDGELPLNQGGRHIPVMYNVRTVEDSINKIALKKLLFQDIV